ncbi:MULTISPECIES: phosphatase PAP2 family protein [Nocardiopsis]|uniref:Phosphatase PAP2 family protein n=1 Tax=Nocardiopsis tropica TaxID=109330 RepID=A0ABU7KVJ4_9ACTN|nr:phosphatase PAP2 family protein [Nocardiopsis umidischolae]MEE2053024.1 phosphatase PAP2 family protein [Nocardiopsis umidischolae]
MVRATEYAPGPPVVRAVRWPSVSEIAWGVASDRVAIMLAVALIVMTMLAAGPLHPVDNFLNELPRPYWDVLREPLILWPDTVASRAVALPVLGVTVLQLAYWHRSWRPIVLGTVGVVGMMSLVSVMKLGTNRGHAKHFDPDFFMGPGNVAFPSGHGANAILIYGLVLFLIIRFGAARPHIIRRLAYCIVGIALLQSTVSIYLHFHWFTDLVAGMLAGGFALRVTIRLDRMIPHGRTVEWWPWYGRKEGPLAAKE